MKAALSWLRKRWREIPWGRRIRFTSGGVAFSLGALAVGLAAMNTGNNLLYVLFGSMLGFITVSSWLSEQAIRDLRVERYPCHAVTVGHELRLVYSVTNRKRRRPSLAVEISEAGLPGRAFVPYVAPGDTVLARSVNSFVRRGTYPLGKVTLSTAFPFGMFRKERDIDIPGEVVVWPRADRRVREPRPAGGINARFGPATRGMRGTRGEYRSLRGYRPGDDPKDIHWRSSARQREPVVREYETDGAELSWIYLDTRDAAGEAAEVAIEVAASLAAAATAQHRPFALVVGDAVLSPGDGAGQLERALDILARVDFSPDGPTTEPPVARGRCVLVSIHHRPGFGDVFAVGPDARLDRALESGEAAA